MPMNEYGEIIRNSSPPPPIPPTNNNRNSNNNPKGSGIALVIGIAILVAAIFFIVNANKNKENTNYVDADYTAASDYSKDYNTQENNSDDNDVEYYDTNNTDAGIDEYSNEEYYNSSEENLSDYILPYSDSEYISYSDLDGLSQEEVLLARNEIYARRGRKFTTESIKNYFESKSWYVPQYEPDDFPDSIFNEYEKENIKTIVAYETEKGWK